MKKSLLCALALALTLLSACGPKGGGDQSSAPNIPTRPPAAGDLLPDPAPDGGGSSSSDPDSAPAPEIPTADPEVLSKWRGEYRYQTQYLRQSLAQLVDSYDMTSCSRWPGGRELAFVESTPLLFSTSLSQTSALCAAVAADLPQDLTLEQLRKEWGDSLIFQADDPVAGPCWLAADGNLTYRFRTDAEGLTLLPGGQGGNLVLAADDLLPQQPGTAWITPEQNWVDLWVDEPEGPLAALLPYAQALGGSEAPDGATQPADPEHLELFFAQYGLKDPDTGVQYISYEGGESTMWDGVIVPASLVFDGKLPQNFEDLTDALNTPFSWRVYNMVGYWFYLDQYAVYLSSDGRGAVSGSDYFLIRWGDNAGY